MARPFQRRTCAFTAAFSPAIYANVGEKKRRDDGRAEIRTILSFWRSSIFIARRRYIPLFVRPMCLMLATTTRRNATRRMRKTSCHDTATGGGINYFPSRVILPRSREISPPPPSEKERFRALVKNNFVARDGVFLLFRIRQIAGRVIYIHSWSNKQLVSVSQVLNCVKDFATWLFRFNTI